MQLSTAYSNACGLKIQRPYIYELFFPFVEEKFITIDTDTNGKGGVVGLNIFGSTGVANDGGLQSLLLLEGDGTNFTNTQLNFIDIKMFGEASATNDIDAIHVDPNVNHIIHMGSSESISKAYYDAGNGTTMDATTPFTTAGAVGMLLSSASAKV